MRGLSEGRSCRAVGVWGVHTTVGLLNPAVLQCASLFSATTITPHSFCPSRVLVWGAFRVSRPCRGLRSHELSALVQAGASLTRKGTQIWAQGVGRQGYSAGSGLRSQGWNGGGLLKPPVTQPPRA